MAVKSDKVDYEPAENRAPINESDSDGGMSLLIV